MRQVFNRKDKKWLLAVLIGAVVLLILGFKNSPGASLSDFSLGTSDISRTSDIQDTTEQEGDVLVTRVIDGDTIEIEGGERVRYLGIDTPETVDPNRPVQCFGKEASAKNKELVEGEYVRLERDITDRDKYGRLLRYVYVDDKLVNLELVREGFAFIFTLPPDVKYQDQILAAQQEAREAKRGLWGDCPTL